ncbi:NAD(P)-binding Rossmann-fold containing protein [Glarea lozoyensis ATCC 20868]|uniref:NAD(P)-binding Rossmann-fold containing protein n=1 Tax=Glarea lozoyensis (strain ATCC 20868 / MF5171) TaxID=1116229 RepID=S3EAK3_GLAL2|nr:NAD(P)-binding Rossmann-fold containing protein [Glarea lozoyensis ATCC 20868]EPE35338.1 NAD(P)-binding Rossmann-fold containing protein [Glarea lozoyensis ATCC 20868]
MHLVLTGATGLVGSGVLQHMINASSVSQVSILSRRPVPQADGCAKCNVIIHKDFTNYSNELMAQLKDVDGVVWAQGISQTKVGKEEYFSITNTYPLTFAKALSKSTAPKPVNFIYVSGEGATTSPSFMTSLFGRVKGQTEAELLALSKTAEYANLRPYSVRPAGVDPTLHTEIHEFMPKKTGIEGAVISMFPLFRMVSPGLISPTRELGAFLTGLAEGDGGGEGGEGGRWGGEDY